MSIEPDAASAKIDTRSFFGEGAIDALLQMMLALGSELSAVSEKIDTVIDLLAEQGVTANVDVDNFTPNPEQQARRDAARQRLVQALLAPYQVEAEALADHAARLLAK